MRPTSKGKPTTPIAGPQAFTDAERRLYLDLELWWGDQQRPDRLLHARDRTVVWMTELRWTIGARSDAMYPLPAPSAIPRDHREIQIVLDAYRAHMWRGIRALAEGQRDGTIQFPEVGWGRAA